MKAMKVIRNILGTAGLLYAGYVLLASMKDVRRYIRISTYVSIEGPIGTSDNTPPLQWRVSCRADGVPSARLKRTAHSAVNISAPLRDEIQLSAESKAAIGDRPHQTPI